MEKSDTQKEDENILETVQAPEAEGATKENPATPQKQEQKPKREKYAYQNRSNKAMRKAVLVFNQDTILKTQSKPHNGIVAKIVCQNAAPPGAPPILLPPNKVYDESINPFKLNLLPSKVFHVPEMDKPTPIYNFKSNFFVTKSKTMRFEHKLYNALKISREEPKLIGFLGLYWKNEDTFIVNIPTFGALLGAPYPRAYLCYEAGLFAKHGFRDVTSELINTNPEELKDCNNIPYRHQSGKFNVNMTEEDLDTYCNTDLSTEEHQESK